MKLAAGIALLLAIAPAQAQSSASQLLEDAAKKALSGMAPVSAEERKEVIAALQAMLNKRLTFRDDGVAAATHHFNGSVTYVEWIGLKVEVLKKDSLTAADTANGISRRYRIVMTSASHRVWKATTNRWSDWKPTGYPLFLTGITVEERNGSLEARVSSERGTFLPGPSRSVGPSVVPAASSQGLPPGMFRRE